MAGAWFIHRPVRPVCGLYRLEPIKMQFGLMTPVGPRNHILDGVLIPMGSGNFEGARGSPL